MVEKEAGGSRDGFLLYYPGSPPTWHTSEQSQHLRRGRGSEVEAGTHIQLRSLGAAAQPTMFILSWGSFLRVGSGVDRWKHAAPGTSEMCWIALDKKQLNCWSQLSREKYNSQPWKMESIIKTRQEKLSRPNKQWHWILMFYRLWLNRNGIVSYSLQW